jgi:hypothetical protein
MRHEAMAFITSLAAGSEPVVETETEDHDAFDSADCSIYSDESGDTESVVEMIEDSVVCDCGHDIFVFNKCTQCGATGPWASKLGCGLR